MRRASATIKVVLVLLIALQVAIGLQQRAPIAIAENLPDPPQVDTMRLLAMGEPVALAQLLTLWLQAFDNQPGVSLPYAALDFQRVARWLSTLLALDPNSNYPLVMAASLYGQVADPDKARAMLMFLRERFREDPAHRWRWMAHAVIAAKHRLHDLPLAHRLARELALEGDFPVVPRWAKQMHIFLLEDLGEYESARILLGGLLASGQIVDPHEKRLLIERLNALQQGEISSKPPSFRSNSVNRSPN